MKRMLIENIQKSENSAIFQLSPSAIKTILESIGVDPSKTKQPDNVQVSQKTTAPTHSNTSTSKTQPQAHQPPTKGKIQRLWKKIFYKTPSKPIPVGQTT